ncbi:MAG: protein translocase subunit SecD [Planctomycetaceae bacterium]|nr:protein translocase subunit SecD [Planctomycetaceae bacterium]
MNPLGANWLLLAEDAKDLANETVSDGSSWQGILTFLFVVAVIVLPFVIGNVIAAALRMKEVGTRIGVTLFVLTLCAIPFFLRPLDEALSLGIDLAGGTNLVYEIDREAAEENAVTPAVMEKMVEAIRKRVNPSGTEEVTVRGVGADRIEIIVPGADQEKTERIKKQIVNLGELEFALLADRGDHRQLIELALSKGNAVKNIVKDNAVVAEWHRSAKEAETGNPKINLNDSQLAFRDIPSANGPVREYLVVVDPVKDRRITGRMLRSIGQSFGDNGLSVTFKLDSNGARLFREVTTEYRPREGKPKTHLAILLNGEIHSAPVINSPIPGGSGQIDGRFTREEIDELMSVLNAGSLVVPLNETPVNESTVSPTLGKDVQEKGKWAMIWSLLAVFIFTAGYYLTAGFVADVCLALNIVLVMGVMSIIDATFTLPGLAGLVLTVGMAVDANVLIFERIREERSKGSSLRMAIKNGFEKAFMTIFDSNLTTLLTAVVLYYIGTDQVKGFAVALFVGICASMFSAVYIGRLIFDIAEKKKWITDLKMFSLIGEKTNIDFVGKKKLAAIASIVLIAVGLVAVGMRGKENLDIDFRGGAMVTFSFEEGSTPTFADVKATLEPKFDKSLALEELEAVQDGGGTRKMYRMRTVTEAGDKNAAERVKDEVRDAFAATNFKLILQNVTFGAVEDIPASTDPTPNDQAIDPFPGGHIVDVTLKEVMTAGGFADAARSYLEDLELFSAEDLSTLVVAELKSDDIPADSKVTDLRLKFGKAITKEQVEQFLPAIKSGMEAHPLFDEVNTFDSQVAGEAQNAAIWAMILSLLMIIGYLWYRFQTVSFGLAAVVALVHDVLITLGAVAIGAYLSGTPLKSVFFLEDFKINLSIVAAFLTIIGYSLNDTIVVFDRIREVRGRNPNLTDDMVNLSLNQTLSRTLLTSLTTFIVLVILYVVGGEGIHGFAFCLLLGIIVGTYSSIYVASPVLVYLMNRNKKPAVGAA